MHVWIGGWKRMLGGVGKRTITDGEAEKSNDSGKREVRVVEDEKVAS